MREAIDEIDIPHHLTRRVPGVRLYAPSLKSTDLVSPGYAFFTTRTADLLRWMAQEAKSAGAHLLFGTRFEGATRDGDLIRLAGIDLAGRYLIGADGARSRVAECFGLSRNRRFLTGLEFELEPDDSLDPRFLHCFVDSRLAPGYIAWAAPGPDAVQLGLAVRHGARPDLAAFMAATDRRFGWSGMKVIGRRSGLIPCGGPLRRIAAPGVLLIGDAAGWVSPMTGGGIRLAFHYGRRAASLVADHLQNQGSCPGDPALARTSEIQGKAGSSPGSRCRPGQPASRSRAFDRAGAPHRRERLFPPPRQRRRRPRGLSPLAGSTIAARSSRALPKTADNGRDPRRLRAASPRWRAHAGRGRTRRQARR